jgi:bifunctional ADP-heptose synthase (sugar kinase/adenylyltransferase)
MLAALEIVDYVAVIPEASAVIGIESLKPDFYVKGPDYAGKDDPSGRLAQEEAAVQKHGGRLVFTGDETHSSSKLLNEYFPTWSEHQKKAIAAVKELGGLDLVNEILNRVAKLKILIVGEPIIDTYVFCCPESISSKGSAISAKFLGEENYLGGSLAIANHMADFAGETSLLITGGNEPFFIKTLEVGLDKRIRLFKEALAEVPTPRKTRFISDYQPQRLFELTSLRSDQWKTHSPLAFCENLYNEARKNDAVLVADFGHGLFEGPVLSALADLEGFVALNVQTNSSNFGFNPFTKHKRFSFLSIDRREAQLAYHDRLTPTLALGRKIAGDLGRRGIPMVMTLGDQGAAFFPLDGKEEIHAPAFADKVIDATGAGDAFFALTSLLVKVNTPEVLVPFLGNVFAGLKTRILGNKAPVTRAQFLKAVTSILK